MKWALDHGGTSATIVSHVPGTGDKWSEIVVRCNTESADNSFTKAVEIKAYDTGENSKLAAVRRTVFKISYEAVNVADQLNENNTLRFGASGGVPYDQAGVKTPGGGFDRFAAKTETIGNISPGDIAWSSRGVVFTYSESPPPTAKWQFRMMRDKRRVRGVQENADVYRTFEPTDWVNDGASDPYDAQNPSDAVPNLFFRLDAPSFHTNRLQRFYRNDFREFVQWHNGEGFVTCSPYAYWYADLTARYPDMVAVAPNQAGVGTNASAIPNKRPTVIAGEDQIVDEGDLVTLSASSVDADGNPSNIREADNDELTINAWQWTQTAGPNVTLTNGGNNRIVAFTAPDIVEQTELRFSVTVQDGTGSLEPDKFRPGNSVSNPDEIVVTVNPL